MKNVLSFPKPNNFQRHMSSTVLSISPSSAVCFFFLLCFDV